MKRLGKSESMLRLVAKRTDADKEEKRRGNRGEIGKGKKLTTCSSETQRKPQAGRGSGKLLMGEDGRTERRMRWRKAEAKEERKLKGA